MSARGLRKYVKDYIRELDRQVTAAPAGPGRDALRDELRVMRAALKGVAPARYSYNYAPRRGALGTLACSCGVGCCGYYEHRGYPDRSVVS